jgi:hypothetical protein
MNSPTPCGQDPLTLTQRCSRKWMFGHAAYALVLFLLEDSSLHKSFTCRENILPPSQGESLFPLDDCLSWMSRISRPVRISHVRLVFRVSLESFPQAAIARVTGEWRSRVLPFEPSCIGCHVDSRRRTDLLKLCDEVKKEGCHVSGM